MRVLWIVLASMALAPAAYAAEVGGIRLDDRLRLATDGPELVLNGAGVRSRVIADLYVAGLYLVEKKSQPGDVLALGGAKRVAMTLLLDLPAPPFAAALNDSFANNHARTDRERHAAQLDDLTAAIESIAQLKKGDVIALDYRPEAGTQLVHNGAPRGKPIGDEAFYRALLRIWLGERPIDVNLKQALLGAR